MTGLTGYDPSGVAESGQMVRNKYEDPITTPEEIAGQGMLHCSSAS